MDSAKEIGERIKAVIEALGLTQTEFAKKLNISPSMVSKMCSGASEPSSRTISDIHAKFNIDEFWLITGFGEMFHKVTVDEKIATFLGEILNANSDPIYRQFVLALSESSPEELQALKKFAFRLLAIENSVENRSPNYPGKYK